jgi:hypothetical protein
MCVPRAGCIVDHPQPCLLPLGNPGLDVLDTEGHVVQPLAALFQKRGSGAGWVGRFEQCQADIVDAQEPDAALLVEDVLHALEDRIQHRLVSSLLGTSSG